MIGAVTAAVALVTAVATADPDAAIDTTAGGTPTTRAPAGTAERRSSETAVTGEPSPTTTPTTTTSSTTTITSPPPPVAATPALRVSSVTDGDTVVLSDGRRVRLAQVDAPETNECFGSASTAALRALVEGRGVTLRPTTNGPAKDRYGRTVAVLVLDGRDINETVVRDGAAEWGDEFAREDPALAAALALAESDARRAGRGLWSACAAAAPRSPSPSSSPSTTTTTTAAPAPVARGGNCHPAYPDDCIPPPPPDLNCPDIGRRVRVDHSHGDPHRFDGNKDGWGCESYG